MGSDRQTRNNVEKLPSARKQNDITFCLWPLGLSTSSETEANKRRFEADLLCNSPAGG